MKTNQARQRGNALIYVLIAIALFAALGFIMARQGDSSETSALPAEKAEIYAAQMISYAAQTRQVVEQMLFSGTSIDALDFMLPDDPDFEDAPTIHKVYHPQGGGLVRRPIPAEVVAQVSTAPPAGWYLGAFNNVEWTESTGTDVILIAYQISQPVCAAINAKITGSPVIPSIVTSMKLLFIDDATTDYGAGVNTDLTTDDPGDICPACDNTASLCVEQGGMYGFYTVIADR